jgi:hypothetical protein
VSALSTPFDPDAFAASLSPFLHAPFAYWSAKRGGRPMPARADLDPLEMLPWLPQTMLAEPLADGDFRFRLVGTDVRERLGCEMTGRRLSELPVGREHLHDLLAEYRAVVDRRLPAHHFHGYPEADARQPFFFDRLLCPLSSDGVTVDLLLGVRHDRVAAAVQLPGAPQISLSRASRPQLNR